MGYALLVLHPHVTDHSAAPTLFSPFGLKSLRLRNRFAMAPMTREFSPEGVPGADVARYYALRAAGGVGLIITEGTYIRDAAAGPSLRVPRFYGERSFEGWRAVVDAVHAAGGAIIPQLWHTGAARGSRPKFNPDVLSSSPSGLDLSGQPLGRELTTADLDGLVADFTQAAVEAKRVGFDGVELHGAHGYLLDQFLWERTNRRRDGFGGSAAARTRFPVEVVKAIRSAVGEDFAIVYRFSQWKGGHYDARLAHTPQELEEILLPLVGAGVDILHASTRRYWLPAFEDVQGPDAVLGLAGWARKLTGAPTITVGSVGLNNVFQNAWTPGASSETRGIGPLVEQFDRGEFDLVAVGRALLSDPEWVNKTAAGRTHELVPFSVEHRERLS
jgi:2,4-dienoyl-CoA reductase-like NADH-dependent reductase (Old Yellow Enzyme family)